MGNRHTTSLPNGWKGSFLAALGSGNTIAQAAAACEVSVPHLYRLRTIDDTFRAEWDAAKKLRTEYRRDWILDKLHEIAQTDEHKAQIPALFKLFDALPENRSREITVSGDETKPILVTHQRGLTLADLIHDPRAARLVEQASRELPAAREVLAELDSGVDPASDLPVRPEP